MTGRIYKILFLGWIVLVFSACEFLSSESVVSEAGALRECTIPPQPFRRLTNREVVNTVFDILVSEHARGSSVHSRMLDVLPKEEISSSFASAPENQISDLRHVEASFKLMDEVFKIVLGEESVTELEKVGAIPYVQKKSKEICSAELQAADTDCIQKLAEYYTSLFLRGQESLQLGSEPQQVFKRILEETRISASEGFAGVEALKLYMSYLISHPSFLFRDLTASPTGIQAKEPVQLAEALTLAFWGSADFREINTKFFKSTVDRFDISDADSVRSLVHTLLIDERSKSMVRTFANEWFGYNLLKDVQNHTSNENAEIYDLLRKETEMFLEFIIRGKNKAMEIKEGQKADVLDLIKGSYTFANQTLRDHYGERTNESIGEEFKFTELKFRRGIATHGGVHAITSHDDQIGVVNRGKWIMDRLLCQEGPGSIPDNAGDILKEATQEEDVMSQSGMRQIEVFANLPDEVRYDGCKMCHIGGYNLIGMALEPFDHLGRFNTTDFPNRITAKPDTREMLGIMPTPDWTLWMPNAANVHSSFANYDQMIDQLITDDKDRLYQCISGKLLTYVTGHAFDGYSNSNASDCVSQTRFEMSAKMKSAATANQKVTFVDLFTDLIMSKAFTHVGGYNDAAPPLRSPAQRVSAASPEGTTDSPSTATLPQTGNTDITDVSCKPMFDKVIETGACVGCHNNADYVHDPMVLNSMLMGFSGGKLQTSKGPMPPRNSLAGFDEAVASYYESCVH